MDKSRAFRFALVAGAVLLSTTGSLCQLPHNTPLQVTSITLTGPSGNVRDHIPEGAAMSNLHQFTVSFTANNPTGAVRPLVRLVSENGGGHSGGLFGWQRINSFAIGSHTATVNFHLFCPGPSVVGADQVRLGCSGLTGCLCSNAPTCATTAPCSCYGWDGVTPNDPNSNQGGTGFLANAVVVHAEVSSGPDSPPVASNTMAINCM
jgi:hypothetical protein